MTSILGLGDGRLARILLGMDSEKTTLWIIVGVMTTVGSYVPVLWGADALGVQSVLGGMVGGFLGIYIWYRFVRS